MVLPYTRAPHQSVPGSPYVESPHAALLIDFDNVTLGMRSDLSKDLKALLESDIIKGKVSVRRAYADWRRYPQYIVPLSEASVDLIFAPAYGSNKKNATDIRMAIDGIELVFVRPEIGTYILLTGDSDFSSLVLKLKEYGKYVIGVGMQESSSDILVQNCDEYYSYTSLTGLQKTSELQRVKRDPWNLVTVALDKMVQRGDVMRSDRLKQVMREIDPGFDESDLGFGKFSKFLLEAQKRGVVDLSKVEAGQYEIAHSRSGGHSVGRSSAGPNANAARPPGGSGGRRSRPSRRRTPQAQGKPAAARPEKAMTRPATAARPDPEPPTRAEEPKQADRPAESDRSSDSAGPAVTGAASRETGTAKQATASATGSTRPSRSRRKPPRKPEPMAASGSERVKPSDQPAEPELVVDEIGPEPDAGPDRSRGRNGGKGLRGGGTRRRGGNALTDIFAASAASGRGAGPEERPDGGKSPTAGKRPTDERKPTGGRRSTAKKGPTDRPGPAGGRRTPAGRNAKAAGRTPPAKTAASGQEPTNGEKPSGGAAADFDPKALRLPTEPAAVRRYLANRYRGVGEKTAATLIENFGPELFRILAEEPGRLKGVIPPKRAEQLLTAWNKDYDTRRAAG